ncbi:hypothetical protein ABPG74_009852 [Tetrahymena malaccensis]
MILACPYIVSIPSYNIITKESQNSTFVQYCILIEHKISKNVKSLRFRYKELRNLHELIARELEKFRVSINLPEFPSRKMLGKTNTNESSIIQRKNDLEIYLNELIHFTQVQALQTISQLLPSSVDVLAKQDKQNSTKNSLAQKDDLYFMDESDCIESHYNRDSITKMNNNQIQVKIKSFERKDDTILYNVHFYHMTSHLKWKSQYRYSELKNLHLGIKSCHNNKYITLPEFPGRSIFHSTNDNLEEVYKRQMKLEKYLNDLLEIENIYPNNQALKNFIDSSKRQAFAEQITQQYLKDNNIQYKQNINLLTNNIQNGEINIRKKPSKFKFSQHVDFDSLLFYHQTEHALAKQQKKMLKRKIKKSLNSLQVQLVYEEREIEEQNSDNEY